MLNSNEQYVIDIASGTFEYQGELYTVRTTYVKALTNKLDEKDVELTQEQANKAIQVMFANVERGVKEGYLKKLSGEEEEAARKQGEIRQYSEFGLSEGKEEDKAKGKPSGEQKGQEQKQEPEQEPQMVTGKDGNSYPLQKAPLQMNQLEVLRTSEIEAIQSYTPNGRIADQLDTNEQHMALAVVISWAVCIFVLTIYLKKFKHRKKAFFVMLGAALMSLSVFVAGNIYVYNSWAYSSDTWQTAAVESGYFTECSKLVQKDLQKIFDGLDIEAGVELLALDESEIYRDAKSIFTAHLAGKKLPKLEKRKKEIQESLRLVLVHESNENVIKVSDVIMERYRKLLDMPYASCLYESRQKEQNRNVIIFSGCFVLLLTGIVLIWRGSKYIHRKFRGLSYGFGIVGVSFVLASIKDMLWGTKIQAEPQAYQALFRHYVNWRSENILYFGILLLCISVFTWGAAYVTKKNHIEKQGLK